MEMKQNDNTSDIFNVPKLINYISTFVTLESGDLIVNGTFVTLESGDLIVTGTPGGNGPIQSGLN